MDKLVEFVTETNYKKICLYLESVVNYLPEPEDTDTLQIILKIYQKMSRIPESLKIALALEDHVTIFINSFNKLIIY